MLHAADTHRADVSEPQLVLEELRETLLSVGTGSYGTGMAIVSSLIPDPHPSIPLAGEFRSPDAGASGAREESRPESGPRGESGSRGEKSVQESGQERGGTGGAVLCRSRAC